MKKILLHCCCAPCLLSCIDYIGEKTTLFWYNPNIHPWTEYRERRDCLAAFAEKSNLPLIVMEKYGLREFIASAPFEEKEKRCRRCYETRLSATAEFAAQNGFDAFSSTLLASIYQNHEYIMSLGESFAKKYGVGFYYRDFRPNFRQGNAAAREQGLYMQKYCGCIFSEEERYQKKIEKDAVRFPHTFLLEKRKVCKRKP